MSKTIIITTDEMKNILKTFIDKDVVSDVYCSHCLGVYHGCPHPNDSCNDITDDVMFEHFINIRFANYMIPFS